MTERTGRGNFPLASKRGNPPPRGRLSFCETSFLFRRQRKRVFRQVVFDYEGEILWGGITAALRSGGERWHFSWGSRARKGRSLLPGRRGVRRTRGRIIAISRLSRKVKEGGKGHQNEEGTHNLQDIRRLH